MNLFTFVLLSLVASLCLQTIDMKPNRNVHKLNADVILLRLLTLLSRRQQNVYLHHFILVFFDEAVPGKKNL